MLPIKLATYFYLLIFVFTVGVLFGYFFTHPAPCKLVAVTVCDKIAVCTLGEYGQPGKSKVTPLSPPGQ